MAILWGDGRWARLVVEPLLSVESVALCAPSQRKLAKTFFRAPTSGNRMLLHHRDHGGWMEWFESAGLDPEAARHGQVFDDSNVVIEAAAAGQGFALGYLPISQAEVDFGRLALAHAHRCPTAENYYLVYRQEVLKRQPVAVFRRWLLREALGLPQA